MDAGSDGSRVTRCGAPRSSSSSRPGLCRSRSPLTVSSRGRVIAPREAWPSTAGSSSVRIQPNMILRPSSVQYDWGAYNRSP